MNQVWEAENMPIHFQLDFLDFVVELRKPKEVQYA